VLDSTLISNKTENKDEKGKKEKAEQEILWKKNPLNCRLEMHPS
jgi:hypothetical protein